MSYYSHNVKEKYTFLIKTDKITNDNWDSHYELLDYFKGSSLVENPYKPEMIITMIDQDKETAKTNLIKLTKAMGINITSIKDFNNEHTE